MNKILPAFAPITIDSIARYSGEQETPNRAPWFGRPMPIWTLTETISPTLIKGTTVAQLSIEAVLATAA